MALDERFLDELKGRIRLSEIVGQHVSLKRAGYEFKACCPFHKEKTPSFTLNDQKGFYHCFGCGAHGDVISFLTEYENLGFMEAVEILAGKAGMEVPKSSPEAKAQAQKAKNLYDLYAATAQFFQNELYSITGRQALLYLQNRGLTAATIRDFKLGYSPSNSHDYIASMRREGFSIAQMLEAGLIRDPRDGRSPYAFFRNRVMFPVADRRGRIVAFGARLLEGNGPKYINSPENPLFHKRRILYGLDRARMPVGKGAELMVVEGYMDVIALADAGYEGAVAPLGTALTEEQIEALWHILPPESTAPILCFDGDRAGQAAAAKAVERVMPLLGGSKSLNFAFLPEGEDPDSIVQSGGKVMFDKILRAGLPLVEMIWVIRTGGRAFRTPEAQAGLKAELRGLVDKIEDRDLKIYYWNALAYKLDEAFPSPWQRKQKTRNFGKNANRFGSNRGQFAQGGVIFSPVPKEVMQVRVLLAAMLNYPQIYEGMEEVFAALQMPTASLEKLRNAIMDVLDSEEGLDCSELHAKLCLNRVDLGEIERILCPQTYLEGKFAAPDQEPISVGIEWLKRAQEYMMRGLGKDIERMKKKIADDMSEADIKRLQALQRDYEAFIDREEDEDF